MLALLFVSGTSVAVVYANAHDKEDRVPGQYIVVLKDSVVDSDLVGDALVEKHKGQKLFTYNKAVKGFAAVLPDAEVVELKKDPRVLFVSEDRKVEIVARPSDVTVMAQSLPTGVNRINAENKLNKGAGVHVAVIDTGIDLKHQDLNANIAGGKNCSTGRSYTDGNGHGTHVAGTIAALKNDRGVVGVAPEAKLWSVRVLNNSGSGTWSSVICGVDFVTSKAPANGGPITVANMSLGGGGASDNACGKDNNDALHYAICRSRDAGVTYVVAAGNEGVDTATSYGADDTFASFSNFGSAVDIAAPGVKIYSTWKGGGYATLNGTSMATPHVAGAAALYIAAHPGATWTAVRDALVAAGEALGDGHTDPSGLHPEVLVRADTL